jgi:hypothetical protein
MASQDQRLDGSQVENSQVQLVQAGQDAVSFQNSHDNRVTINTVILRLFGHATPPPVDWDWAHRLLEQKQLPEIRKRLTDTLGRDRTLMQLSLEEQLSWVGRSPLEAERRLQVQGEDQGRIDWQQLLIATFGREDIAGKLLILGTPGAGKTTALLSLAEQLVCGAIAKPKTVIPVWFELSTWRDDNQSIRDWLVEQLYDLHGGDRKAKRYEQWLDQQVLLPLLDGLDELGLERQRKCTLKLNEFAHHYPQLVVCCRFREFEQVDIKLNNLNGAVRLEPLSNKQMQAYLESIGRSQLWSVIQSTSTLHNLLEPTDEGDPGLLRMPLFLTLAATAYDAHQPFQTKTELLQQYVERQLSRDVRESDRRKEVDLRQWAYKTPTQEPDWRETQQTLCWFARQLQRTSNVELLIEQIQPSWLEDQKTQQIYMWSVNPITSLIFIIILWIFYVVSQIVNWMSVVRSFTYILGPILGLITLIAGLIIVPVLLWASMLIALLPLSLLETVDSLDDVAVKTPSDIKRVEAFKNLLLHDVRQEVLEGLKRRTVEYGPVICLFGVVVGVMIWLTMIRHSLATAGVFCWMAFLLLLGTISIGRRNRWASSIVRICRICLLILLLGGPLLSYCMMGGLIVQLIIEVIESIIKMVAGVIFGVIVVGVIGLISGVFEEIRQDLALRSRPNQGIWNSWHRFLWTIALSYLFAGIISGLETHAYVKLFVLIVGFGALQLGFLWGGGLACLQHLCLRIMLWQSGVAPWNLARFLNYCVERKLLQRVGGRYRFLHRELLDYFASQPPTT